MTFEEAMPLVRKICWKWARVYRLECDELVNELFLSCDFTKFSNICGEGMGRYIEYRLIDYMRRGFGRPVSRGAALRRRTVYLGCDTEGKFAGFDDVDNADEWEYLMLRVRPTDQKILRMYYRDGLTQQEIADKMGVSKSNISMRHNAILERLRRKVG